MNFQHLRYVIEVEATKSISQAAKNLAMGQPNLSKAIKDLENEIGITIFNRTRVGVTPTKSGEEFLHYANTIISQLDELQSLYVKKAEKELSIRICVPRASYISTVFAEFLNEFAEEKKMDVSYKEESPWDTIQDIASGESNIGVVRYQSIYESYFSQLFQKNQFEVETFHEFEMVLLMKKTHPLAQLADIPYHLLNDYTEIVHGDYHIPSLQFGEIGKEVKVVIPSKRIYVYDRASQFDLLETTKGTYMWASPIGFTQLAKNDLVQKPCSAGGHNKDVIIYKNKANLNLYEKRLIKYLKETAYLQV